MIWLKTLINVDFGCGFRIQAGPQAVQEAAP